MSQLSEQEKSKWVDHLLAQKGSGLSQKAYCDKHALKHHQFWYWRSKLEGGNSKKTKAQSKTTSNKFVPVKASLSTPSQGLTVTLPNGIIFTGIEERNLQVVQRLIGALQ